MPRVKRPLAALLLGLAPLAFADEASVGVQRPSARWLTAETAHVVLHYPEAFGEFGRHLSARMEPVHEALAAAIGYRRKDEQDLIAVLVVDPFSASNGMAFPLLSHPHVVLWATPPSSDSQLGSLSDWGEVLLAHELGHVLHLTRPQNRQSQILRALLPVGPLVLAPRWAIEGYATALEGRLTGSGRPSSVWRAALLRAWAAEGRLPSYAGMGTNGGWIGGSYAYLVGSAFLEWLETREGEGSLTNLWKSATRRGGISFARAFEKTFGRSAPELYARFTAEVTANALEEEKALGKEGVVEGEAWQRFNGAARAPQVSPDGKRLLLERRPPKKPAELLVFTLETTAEEKEARRRLEEREKKRLEDPEEPRDRPVVPAPRKCWRRLPPFDGASAVDPRFLPDGKRVLFSRKAADPFGVLHDDLWLWEAETGAVSRVTRFQDVRFADPFPSGERAVAVRRRFGKTSLATIDLASGETKPLEVRGLQEGPFDIWDAPRVSPEGGRLAALRHHDGVWQLVLVELPSGEARILDTGTAQPAGAPSWTGSGRRVLVATDRDGTWNLEEIPISSAIPTRRLTRVFGAVLDPAPTPDGSAVFFVSLTPKGFDLRRLALDAVPDGGFPAHVLERPKVRPQVFQAGARPPEHAYETLRSLTWGLDSPARFLPSGSEVGLLAGGGDAVGRLEGTVGGGWGWKGGTSGGAAAVRGRDFSFADVVARGYALVERPGSQVREARPERDRDRFGVEAVFERKRLIDHGATALSGGLLLERTNPKPGDGFSRWFGHFEGEARYGKRGETWGGSAAVTFSGAAGRSGPSRWELLRTGLELAARTPIGRLSAFAEEGWTFGTPSRFDLFTVGSAPGTFSPESDRLFLSAEPALPSAVSAGDRLEARRVEWAPAGPLVLHASTQRTLGSSIRVAGVDLRIALEDFPLQRGGRAELLLGISRIFDAPLENRNVGYFSLGIRP